MSAPQSLLQAALNRLAARLGSGLADTAATLSLLAQDAPARLQQEVSLFWEEVEREAERLERGDAPSADDAGGQARGVWSGFQARAAGADPASADPQEMIDALRARVASLAERLDGSGAAGASASAPASGAPGSGPS